MTEDEAYTALCIWEAMLEYSSMPWQDKHQPLPEWLVQLKRQWEDEGTCAMRFKALALADLCERVWALQNDPDCSLWATFDWDFVPAFVAVWYESDSRDAGVLADTLRRQRLGEGGSTSEALDTLKQGH